MNNQSDPLQSQYAKNEWSRLCANPAFVKARDAGETAKAEEIANLIITGYEPNQKEPRLHV